MKKTMCLCAARHEMPSCIEGAIFANEVNPLDLNGMRATVKTALEGVDSLDLYVTGLTVALGEVIAYCVREMVDLTLFHYDRSTGRYYPQPIIRTWTCPFCGGKNLEGSWGCTWCQST